MLVPCPLYHCSRSSFKPTLISNACALRSSDSYRIYRWFICDRYTVCYEHDSHGNPLAGSIDALRDAVRGGLSIKVGLLGIAALSSNHMTQGQPKLWTDNSVTFLPSLQPVIKSDGSVCMNTDGYA